MRVPYADRGLDKIPDGVSDEQALFVVDILATGFWAARISEITPEDTVLISGAGPTGICTDVYKRQPPIRCGGCKAPENGSLALRGRRWPRWALPGWSLSLIHI